MRMNDLNDCPVCELPLKSHGRQGLIYCLRAKPALEEDEADPISIKTESEIRHAFAHLWYAVDDLIDGCPLAAREELRSIAGLIFWDDDSNQGIERWLRARRHHEKLQGKEELQGQEVLQGQVGQAKHREEAREGQGPQAEGDQEVGEG